MKSHENGHISRSCFTPKSSEIINKLYFVYKKMNVTSRARPRAVGTEPVYVKFIIKVSAVSLPSSLINKPCYNGQ